MGKKRKNYYVDKSKSKKGKFGPSYGKLVAGVCGFIITHDRGKEKLCSQNAFRLLNHFADRWYGEFNKPDGTNSEEPIEDCEVGNLESDSDSDDIAQALCKEVETLQKSIASKSSSKLRFNLLKTGCKNLIFVKSEDLGPSTFMQRLMVELKKNSTDLFATPFLLRMHPADVSCKAHLNDIKQLADSYLPTAFDKLTSETDEIKKEFDIIYRHRNNDHLSRIDIIDVIKAVVEDNSCLWTYNCRSNSFVLIIEVLRNVCFIGVADNYNLNKKLNVKELRLSQNMHSNSDNITKNKPVQTSVNITNTLIDPDLHDLPLSKTTNVLISKSVDNICNNSVVDHSSNVSFTLSQNETTS